jgi:sulfatase maturation enzyme AslB (radical SAM superfamily)
MKVKAVTFSGAGEPTIYKNFAKALLILSRTDIKFAMLTNGSFFSGNVAKMFAKYGSWVRVSIDGWDRESYKKFRSADDFDKVINNILSFKSDKCLLGLNIVVTKENVNHIHKIIEQVKGSQVKEVKISPCVVGDNIEDNIKYHADTKHIIEAQVEKIRSMRMRVAYTYHNQFDEFLKDYTFCPNLQIRPVIGADLNIYSCHDKAYEKEGLIGSFKECSFKKAWQEADKFKINPSRDCQHHCIAHNKNKLVHSFLGIYKEHIDFV